MKKVAFSLCIDKAGQVAKVFVFFRLIVLACMYGEVLRRFTRAKSTYTNNAQVGQVSLTIETLKSFHMTEVKLIFSRCLPIGKLREDVTIPPVLSFEQNKGRIIAFFGEHMSSKLRLHIWGQVD